MHIKLSGNLARFISYQRALDIDVGERNTVIGVIYKMVEQYPALKEVVLDRQGGMKRNFHVSLNGEKIRVDEFHKETLNEDRLDIFTAIAGG
ncbi:MULTISPECIES: MoaD/ThiS family protein [Pseudomonas]|uniref:Uncharacterized protein n=1 Tax=Pseudomonas lundensis TaxID=86185 RepID=A0A266N5S2_9PSED|nr:MULTISPECIES: MoaD/ThiS family protein [Pseudomonas]NMY39159.1 MoaD/ThiS family protein [Pseudomonas sp. WS 5078]NMY62075.1 MoaD/ThiS family protein [Pseudomonas sp. WS 5354]OZY57841.1 hypothetical protein CJF39_19220 [Pseudomonas lundensis]